MGYKDSFNSIGIKYTDSIGQAMKRLEAKGYTQKSICYAMQKAMDVLIKNKSSKVFWHIFYAQIKMWAIKKDSPKLSHYERSKNRLYEMTGRKIRHDHLNGFVYFIQGENGGAIKIGYTYNIDQRIASLQTGYPDKLLVLADIPGDEVVESELHKIFSEYKLRGEWFKPSDELISFIRHIRKAKLKLIDGGLMVSRNKKITRALEGVV